jgi:hypothetical protein
LFKEESGSTSSLDDECCESSLDVDTLEILASEDRTMLDEVCSSIDEGVVLEAGSSTDEGELQLRKDKVALINKKTFVFISNFHLYKQGRGYGIYDTFRFAKKYIKRKKFYMESWLQSLFL